MNWFAKLKVGGRLTTGFSVMMALIIAVGAIGYFGTRAIRGNLEEIFAVQMPSMDFLIEADRDLQQALVAERSMIFTNVKSEKFKSLVKDYEENVAQAWTRWGKYKALAATSEETALFPGFEKAYAQWKAVSRRVVDGRAADTREGRRAALDLTLGEAGKKFEAMRDYLDRLTGINLENAQKAKDESEKSYRRTAAIQGGGVFLGLLASVFLMWAIGRSIVHPLRNMIEGLNASSEQVASAAGQVASASQTLAEGSSQQAASLEETTSSLEEMSSMSKQSAGNAGQADSLMKETNRVVETANTSMTDLSRSMDDISAASQETQKIVKTIDEIAFQTNLLALNAAVEAARAGEAGAGFAVVADEVRNLAMRAADAARNTASLIEETVKKVQGGAEVVLKTSDAFGEVSANSGKVGGLVSEIAAASGEQAQGIEQVNRAVFEMDKLTQANAANAEESASASEEMSAQAEQMKSYVEDLTALVGSTGRHRTGAKGSKSAKKAGLAATVPLGQKAL